MGTQEAVDDDLQQDAVLLGDASPRNAAVSGFMSPLLLAGSQFRAVCAITYLVNLASQGDF